MTGEGVERELKLPCRDLDAVRLRLRELGATLIQAPHAEDNWVFDRVAFDRVAFDRVAELRERGEVLRLRRDGHGIRLTFKGAPRWEDGVKVREEREVHLDDAVEGRALLEALGYRVVRRYQKVREEWRLHRCEIALDRTPVGAFVEFEGEDAADVARGCSFDPRSSERRSYLELYEDYRRDHPEAPEDMLFP